MTDVLQAFRIRSVEKTTKAIDWFLNRELVPFLSALRTAWSNRHGTYAESSSDYVWEPEVEFFSALAALTVTLPSSHGWFRWIVIKNESDTDTVTVNAYGGEEIDEFSTHELRPHQTLYLSPDPTNGHWHIISRFGARESFGGYYMDSPTATPNTSGTPVKLAGTTVIMDDVENFTHTNNRLTYTGTHVRPFNVDVTMAVESSKNSTLVSAWIYKNGAVVTGSMNNVYCKTLGEQFPNALFAQVSLSPNDYIEVWADSDVGNPDITADTMTVRVEER